MRVTTRKDPGPGAEAFVMITGEDFTTACLKGPLRRPVAALDPRLLRQLTHTNPRSPVINVLLPG
jgi:hypothetical protein